MICPQCYREFPCDLLNEMAIGDDRGLRYELKCPLCALRTRNEMHGLPADTPFQGEMAAAMYDLAVMHLKRTKQPETYP